MTRKKTKEEILDTEKLEELFFRWRDDPSEENHAACVAFITDQTRPGKRGWTRQEGYGGVVFYLDPVTDKWIGFSDRDLYRKWLHDK